MHVYFRGNHRCNVFYEDLDKYMFLRRCSESAEKYQTKILEFVIMDNHVHLQILTLNVTAFMRNLLNRYSKWYNAKYGIKGQLFCSPFNSAIKKNNQWILNSMLYILQNPLATGVYKHPREFFWSSYQFHFNSRPPLGKHISIDTDFLDSHFKRKIYLDQAILSRQIFAPNIKEDREIDKISNAELLKIVKSFSNKHSIFGMEQDRLKDLIKELYQKTPATILQIVSVTHTTDLYVKDVCKNLRR